MPHQVDAQQAVLKQQPTLTEYSFLRQGLWLNTLVWIHIILHSACLGNNLTRRVNIRCTSVLQILDISSRILLNVAE